MEHLTIDQLLQSLAYVDSGEYYYEELKYKPNPLKTTMTKEYRDKIIAELMSRNHPIPPSTIYAVPDDSSAPSPGVEF